MVVVVMMTATFLEHMMVMMRLVMVNDSNLLRAHAQQQMKTTRSRVEVARRLTVECG